MKILLISLGCSKNLVDSEMILGAIEHGSIVTNQSDADIMVVNTCGFIESAKEEAINTILELAKSKTEKQKLIVVGCLATRYQNILKEQIPEVDRFISIHEYDNLGNIINSLSNQHIFSEILDFQKRILSTGNKSVYVKISDGCNNRCAYCAIPLIRGNLRSREIENIYEEVKKLVDNGAIEINLISQDTTNYGFDLYKQPSIIDLLKKLITIPKIKWIRMLYLYPSLISDEFIEFVKNNSQIIPYFDIPIQHSETRLLQLMDRKGNKESYLMMLKKIKEDIPHSILRTTIIVGFPSETDEEFEALLEFIQEVKFDRLGAFPYSKEEDTKSYKMTNQIKKSIKIQRLNKIMEVQKWIALKENQKHLNNIYDVLIEGYDNEMFMYYGRNFAFAPDDIDGCIYVAALDELNVGDLVKCQVVESDFYSLTAKQVKE